MFASHSHESQVFDLFESLLKNVLSGKDGYKPYVDKVLVDAHILALNRNDIFDVDAENLPIVLFLNQYKHEFFQKLNPNEISKKEYSQVLEILQKGETIHE